jgi:hypothetical protein
MRNTHDLEISLFASNFESWLTINLEVKNESSEKICFYRHDHLLTCLSLFCQLFRNFVCHISYCNSQQWLKNKRKDEREYCPEGAMVQFLKVKTKQWLLAGEFSEFEYSPNICRFWRVLEFAKTSDPPNFCDSPRRIWQVLSEFS